jgi:tRNA pseudouridine13 synthase
MDIEPSGEGEHLWLLISKKDQNTSWVAGILAKLAGIKRNDVGYCGMKDRFAITTQWFSLHVPGRDLDLDTLIHSDFTILRTARHNKKLRRGMHQGNRFKIVLRELEVEEKSFDDRMKLIGRHGVPNYFGEQRFGHQGNNLHEVQKLIMADKLKGNRHGTGLYLSAARSWLFNLVLARHIDNADGSLDRLQDYTGPLWGRGRSSADRNAASVEEQVLKDWQDWCYALEHAGLKQERRNLILRSDSVLYDWIEPNQLSLEFSLLRGCFATALLREIAQLSRPSYVPI